MDEISEAKRGLRDRMRRVREALPGPERARRAAEAHRLLLALPEVKDARVILLFASFGAELSTEALVPRLAAEGKRLLLPYLDAEEIEAAEMRPGEPLAASDYGPREPGRRKAVDPAEIDLVVVPGLAFDRSGRRLGYGGGHYDRYLTRLRAGTPAVGIGYDFQLLEKIPHTDLDRRLDAIVTNAEVLRASPL